MYDDYGQSRQFARDYLRSQTHLVLTFFLKHLSNLLLVHWLACEVELKLVFATSHSEDLKPVDFWNKLRCSRQHLFWIALFKG